MNLEMFNSKELEITYLEIAPAHLVVHYLDFVSKFQGKQINEKEIKWESNSTLEDALFNRNEKSIDLALARISSEETISKILVRYASECPRLDPLEKYHNSYYVENQEDELIATYYEKLVLSVLSNKFGIVASVRTADWAFDIFKNYMCNYSKEKHFEAFFRNPGHSKQILEKFLKREYQISSKLRVMYLQRHMFKSHYLSNQPNDEFGYDGWTREIHQLFWNYLMSEDLEKGALAVNLLDNIDNFANVEIDYKLYGLPSYNDNGFDSSNNLLAFFQIFLDKWSKNQDINDLDWRNRSWIIQAATGKFLEADFCSKIYEFSRNHKILPVRLGVYLFNKFDDSNINQCKEALERDGFEFVKNALSNNSFFNFKNSPKLAQWYLKLVSNGLDERYCRSDDEKQHRFFWKTYEKRLENLHQRNPQIYKSPNEI